MTTFDKALIIMALVLSVMMIWLLVRLEKRTFPRMLKRLEAHQGIVTDTPKSTKYRASCPPDQALLVVYAEVCEVLLWIGPNLASRKEGTLAKVFALDALVLPNGVYVWENATSNNDCGSFQLNGEFRSATKEEWLKYVNGKDFWDKSLWLEKSETL